MHGQQNIKIHMIKTTAGRKEVFWFINYPRPLQLGALPQQMFWIVGSYSPSVNFL